MEDSDVGVIVPSSCIKASIVESLPRSITTTTKYPYKSSLVTPSGLKTVATKSNSSNTAKTTKKFMLTQKMVPSSLEVSNGPKTTAAT